MDKERFITNRWARTKHRVAQAEWLSLANINTRYAFRHDATNRRKQVVLAGIRQRLLEFGIGIKMIFDCTFGCSLLQKRVLSRRPR